MPDKPASGRLEGPVLVSACLLGVPCRYDGGSKPCPEIMSLEKIIPVQVCPEQLGGYPTPRPKAWFVGGDGWAVLKGEARVVNDDGEDLTAAFVSCARITLDLARLLGVRHAVLKEGSPSCGVHHVTIEGEHRPGRGVTAALLEKNGIELTSEADWA
jgi:uncharacterized protein YbbK (DUF523 family)